MFPDALFVPAPKAAKCALEFFTAQTDSDHARMAYLDTRRRIAEWCAEEGASQSYSPPLACDIRRCAALIAHLY
jgi:hypothetical protein